MVVDGGGGSATGGAVRCTMSHFIGFSKHPRPKHCVPPLGNPFQGEDSSIPPFILDPAPTVLESYDEIVVLNSPAELSRRVWDHFFNPISGDSNAKRTSHPTRGISGAPWTDIVKSYGNSSVLAETAAAGGAGLFGALPPSMVSMMREEEKDFQMLSQVKRALEEALSTMHRQRLESSSRGADGGPGSCSR